MRGLLVLLGIVVLLAIAALQFGFVSFDQTRPSYVQAPAFKADVAKVSVGKETKTVEVPTINVEKPANSAAPAQ